MVLDPLLSGVSPVLEVPFQDDQAVDYAGFDSVVSHVLATGVCSVMFPGFASEFHKLDDKERDELARLLLEQTRHRRDVAAIVAVQDHATINACRHAADAVARGADAINLLPPYILGPSPDAVRSHIGAVLDAVSPAPVILQYAPAQTGTSLNADSISHLATDHSNLVAVKVESTPPGALIAALAQADPALPAFVGYAGLQLPDALQRGAVGVQPGCSFVELYQEVWRRWHSGEKLEARYLHRRMLPYLSYWMQSVELIVAAEKLVSVRRGWIRSSACRSPAHILDSEEIQMIDRFLDEFGSELDQGTFDQ